MRKYFDPFDQLLRNHLERQAAHGKEFAAQLQQSLQAATWRLNEAEVATYGVALTLGCFWQCYWPYGTRWNASLTSPVGNNEYYDQLPPEHRGDPTRSTEAWEPFWAAWKGR